MRKTVIAVVLTTGALLTGWTSQASACRGANRQPNRESAADAQRAVTCLVNQRRKHHGLRPVHGSVPLAIAAQTHSNAMASQNFFSHGGDGTPASRASAAGYMAGARHWGVGEDLEWASGKGGTPKAIVAGWMASPEHRAVMLSRRFRQVGVGVAQDSPVVPDVQNAATYTALFGFRKG
jgi:uncharacterized protein YkwD